MDRLYSIYTNEAGKIRVLGKGVRNPNAKLAGSLESVTYSEINVSRTKGLGKITSAVASNSFLAIKSGVPVVPVYVQGTNKVMAPGAKFFKRGPVSAIFGEPFYVTDAHPRRLRPSSGRAASKAH